MLAVFSTFLVLNTFKIFSLSHSCRGGITPVSLPLACENIRFLRLLFCPLAETTACSKHSDLAFLLPIAPFPYILCVFSQLLSAWNRPENRVVKSPDILAGYLKSLMITAYFILIGDDVDS